MENHYQIEFVQDGTGYRAHHDFDGIQAEYTNKRLAKSDLAQLRRDNPDYTFRLVTR